MLISEPRDNEALLGVLGRCAEVSITIVGDVMLDEYVSGAVERISPLLGALPVDAAICLRSLYELFRSTVGHLLRSERTIRKQLERFSPEIPLFFTIFAKNPPKNPGKRVDNSPRPRSRA